MPRPSLLRRIDSDSSLSCDTATVRRAIRAFKRPKIHYNNIVCTTKIPKVCSGRLNLRRVARKTLNTISGMGNSHAVSFRFTDPIMTCSLYDTGSIIHCGGKHMTEKIATVRRLIERFQTQIPELCTNESVSIRVVNTMSTVRVPYNVDIMGLYSANPMRTSYFKENFTGCTLTLLREPRAGKKDRMVTATIFTTGSINLAGCISAYEYRKYVAELKELLEDYKDLYADISDDDSFSV